MSCGCQNGGGTTSPAYNPPAPVAPSILNENCPYTLELLQEWHRKLKMAKDLQQADLLQISNFQLNSYIGYVQSAINFPSYLCFYQSQLATIAQVIANIDAL